MVEPSKELELVFEKAINDAKKLQHEYITIEHLLYAMLCENNFTELLKGYGADIDYIKSNLEHHLKEQSDDIKTDAVKYKPKKTATVERAINRAFTRVLFAGRSHIELADVLLSILHEKKSIANYYLEKGKVDKTSFADYVSTEFDEKDIVEEELSTDAKKALRQFTTDLNSEAQKGKIDPIIGRSEELESLALALGRRSKNNVLMVGDPGVGKTAEGQCWQALNIAGTSKNGLNLCSKH